MWRFSNRKCLQLHLAICKVFLIAPYNMGKNALRLHAIILVLLLNILFLHSWIQRANDGFLSARKSVIIVVDGMAQLSFHLTNQIMLVRMLFYRKCFKNFQEKIRKLDMVLGVFWEEKKSLFHVYTADILPVIFVILHKVYLSIEREQTRYYLLELLQTTQYILNVFMIFLFANWLALLSASLNTHLKKSSHFPIEFSNPRDMKPMNLKSITIFHKELSNLMNAFNGIFGYNILLIVIGIGFYILTVSAGCILMTFDSNNEESQKLPTFQAIMHTVSVGIIIVQPYLLALGGTKLKGEVKKIMQTCFDSLNNLPILPKSPREMFMKKGLMRLARQSQVMPPQITAAGFFTVDLSMLGLIVGCLTSYFVVILQFIQATSSNKPDYEEKNNYSYT